MNKKVTKECSYDLVFTESNNLFDLENFYMDYQQKITKDKIDNLPEFQLTSLIKMTLRGILLKKSFAEIAEMSHLSKDYVKEVASVHLYPKLKYFYNFVKSENKNLKNRIIPLFNVYREPYLSNSSRQYSPTEELNDRLKFVCKYKSKDKYLQNNSCKDEEALVETLEEGGKVRPENLSLIDEFVDICGGCGRGMDVYEKFQKALKLIFNQQLIFSKENNLSRISKIAVAENILGNEVLLLQLKNEVYSNKINTIIYPKNLIELENSIRTLKSLSEIDNPELLICNRQVELCHQLDGNYPKKEERCLQALKCRACRAVAVHHEKTEDYIDDYETAVNTTISLKLEKIHIRPLNIIKFMFKYRDILFDSYNLLGNSEIRKDIKNIVSLDDEYKIRWFEKDLFIYLETAINPNTENITKLINSNNRLMSMPKKNHCSFDILKLKKAAKQLILDLLRNKN